MNIDIISYTDAQYAALTAEQLLEVQEAQLKKNRLDLKLEEEKLKEKHRLLSGGVFLSRVWELYCEKLQAEYETEVENIRESLLFYLRFSARPDGGETDAPYEINYAYPIEERLAIVREYYEQTYNNGKERFAAFKEDKVAVQYLGELYAPLYEYYLGQSK